MGACKRGRPVARGSRHKRRLTIRKGALFKLTYKGTAEASPGSILEHFLRIGTAEGQATDEMPAFVSSPARVPRRKQPSRRQQKQQKAAAGAVGIKGSRGSRQLHQAHVNRE